LPPRFWSLSRSLPVISRHAAQQPWIPSSPCGRSDRTQVHLPWTLGRITST
jgi:hypothetical protein